ncbi:DUF4880 domain-containing protein [Lysobacter pythonis]|uniref:DUF4880 domain-containing protein n=1 Tax=Solilutibacter pythonis TaxID=2483112 RepID=A0A3M2HX57_9GAMM|nr:FecR domain-containing protein [Lysobacter pythonis]RMH92855.1 DUF4880 domain-containing protein [Lysobacter pythonis]
MRRPGESGKAGATPAELPDGVLHAAAEWMALLASGEAGQTDIDACRAWRDQHPDHASAWRRAERVFGRLESLPAPLARQALDRPRSSSRRTLLRNALLLAMAVPIGGIAWRRLYGVDHRTGRGERLQIELADGSALMLDADTAVRVDMGRDARRLELVRGRLHVRTATGPLAPARALQIVTRQGVLRTGDARFGAGEARAGLLVMVEQGVLELVAEADRRGGTIAAGRMARIVDGAITEIRALGGEDLAWVAGLLHADGERLDAFLERLARYHRGWLRCDPAVAGLRISGTFRTDDPEGVLAVVVRTLPVKVVRRGPWTLIEAA